jgi:hypothetical protein
MSSDMWSYAFHFSYVLKYFLVDFENQFPLSIAHCEWVSKYLDSLSVNYQLTLTE